MVGKNDDSDDKEGDDQHHDRQQQASFLPERRSERARLTDQFSTAGAVGTITRVSHGQRGEWATLIGQEWARIADWEGSAVVAASVNP
jgi:hypothetical protein